MVWSIRVMGKSGTKKVPDQKCTPNQIAYFKKEMHAMRLYVHCEIRVGGRGGLGVARCKDALHASLSLREGKMSIKTHHR